MTINSLSRVNPIYKSAYDTWKKYKVYIYRYLKSVGYPDKEDAYTQTYFFIKDALESYDQTRGMGLKSWLMFKLKQRLKTYCYATRYLIMRPTRFANMSPAQGPNTTVDTTDESPLDDDSPMQIKDDKESPEYYVIKGEIKGLIESALRSLPPEYEYLVRSKYGIGVPQKTYQELADEKGVVKQNVEQKVRNARLKMSYYIERRYTNIGEYINYEA